MFGRHEPSSFGRSCHGALWEMAGRGHGGPQGRDGRGGPFDFGRGGFPFRRFPWDFFMGGTRARRGDIRAAILALLSEQPRNGYQIMQEIEQRSRGVWRPSPGSVYPALQLLEDEDLVRSEASGNGRNYQLTEKGQQHVKDHPEEVAAPWESVGGETGEQMAEFFSQIGQVASAVAQVARSGNATQVKAAKKILSDARRALYQLLAEEGEDETEPEE